MKIVRCIVVCAVMFSMPVVAMAQFRPFALGFHVSPGIGWVHTDATGYSGGSGLSFSWGLVTEFNLTENHSIATGINFQFMNGKIIFPDVRDIDGSPEDVVVTRKLRVKYLQIPFSLKMRTEERNNMRFFGQFGLGTGFRLKAKGIDEFGSAGSTFSETNSIDGDVSFLRESLIVGLGMEYRISSGNMMSFGLILDNGFTDMLPGRPKATSSLVEMNLAIMF